ncbi:MAG: hypothetical protein KY476_11425 [Planctomycetes bacterium]|nr:hypothetical protein [Planctomycetota bacterium]
MDESTPVTTEAPVDPPQPTSRWRRWLLAATAFLVLAIAPLAEKRYFTCAACGMQRHTVHALSFQVWKALRETNCSRWYRHNVEPHHEHIWVRGGVSEAYSLLGIRIGVSLSSGDIDGPLVRFGSGVRHLMYQRCDDRLALRHAFLRLSRWEKPDTTEREKQLALELALAKWEESGLAGPCPVPAQ